MATIAWPPNTALELTPQSGEQDRRDFGIWNQPRRLPDLSGGAAQRQAVGLLMPFAFCHICVMLITKHFSSY